MDALMYSPRDMPVLPVALARDTIMECVFEMRFADPRPGMAELLPGIMFGQQPGRFSNPVSLPFGQIPKAIRDQNPQLKYMPATAIEGPHGRMMFGEYSVAVSFLKPYPGWTKVKQMILEYIDTAISSTLTGRPERYGLKYVNLLKEGRNEFDLSQTRVRIELGGFPLRPNGPASVHAEIELHGCTNIVDVATAAKVLVPGRGEEIGVLLSVDAVRNSGGLDPRQELPDMLEALHASEKEVFFGLLQGSVIEGLGPQFAATH
jgi:uncharacterized protein (TIGR04255 family)